MIPIPNLIFMMLCWIPFVRSAFTRSEFDLVHSETSVGVPAIRLAEAFFRFVIVAAVIGFGWFLVKDRLFPEKKRVVTSEELVTSQNSLDTEAFSELLKDTETEALMEAIEQANHDSSAPIEQQSQTIKNQILMAQQLGKSRLMARKILGLTQELQLRRKLEFIHLENGVVDLAATNEMMEFARLYKTIQFEESSEQLNDEAKIAEIVGYVSAFVSEGEDSNEEKKLIEIRTGLDGVDGQILKTSLLGQTLLRLSKVARIQLEKMDRSTRLPDELELLLDEFHNDTKIKSMEKLVNLECENFSASKLDYVSAENAYVDSFIIKFRDALDQALQIEDLGLDEYELILGKLEQIAESGWNVAAKEMLTKTNQSIGRSLLDEETLARSNLFENRLSKVGEKLSTNGMVTLDNKPAVFKSRNASMKIVLFIAFEQKQESDVELNMLIKQIQKSKVEINFLNVAVVLVHDNDKMNGLPGLEQLAARMSILSWWQLNINSPEYPRYQDVIAIDNVPLIMVLDEFNRVVAVDPKPIEMQSLFSKMKSNSNTSTNTSN